MSSRGIKLGLLLLAVAAVYLVGNGRTPLFDRDEPRYAQCSRQMLQSGDWVVPHHYDKIRAAKPPGIYWCQATVMAVLGDTAFAARLPSAMASVLTALLLGIVIWRNIGFRHAIWTAFILTSSALMIWSSKICLTDAVLLLCTTTALLCIYVLWRRGGGWMTVVLLAVAIAFGGLVKGPFILGVLAATLLALAFLRWLDRWLQRSRPSAEIGKPQVRANAGKSWTSRDVLIVACKVLLGIAIVVAIVAPWIILVRHRSPQFLGAAGGDALHHLETGSEGHKGFPFYHLALIWGTYLPWSLLLPLSIVLAVKNRAVPQVRFALAAVLGTWVFAEILQTKLPHYMLSAFPPLAFLTADAIVRCLNGEQQDLTSKEMRIGSVFLGGAFIAIAILPCWWLSIRFHDFPWATLVGVSIFGILAGVGICVLFFIRRPVAALALMGLGSLGLGALLFGLYLPRSQPLRLPNRVADVLIQHDAIHPHEAVMFEYKEPSLAFYQGGTIREYDLSLAQLAQNESEPWWVVTKRSIWEREAPKVRAAFDVIGTPMTGLDYSDNLTPVDIVVLRKR